MSDYGPGVVSDLKFIDGVYKTAATVGLGVDAIGGLSCDVLVVQSLTCTASVEPSLSCSTSIQPILSATVEVIEP